MAVNEENAAGGAGRDRADERRRRAWSRRSIRYYPRPLPRRVDRAGVRDFLLTAAAIGGADQVQRLDLRRRGRLPGRGRLGRGDGGRRDSAAALGGTQRAGRERRRDRARASPRHDLRPDRAGWCRCPASSATASARSRRCRRRRWRCAATGGHIWSASTPASRRCGRPAATWSAVQGDLAGGLAVNVPAC